MSSAAPTSTFLSRWLQPLDRVGETFDEEKRRYGAHPGFVNAAFQLGLAICTVLSLHHIVRASFHEQRYVVGDVYVLAWFVVVAATTSCTTGGWFTSCWAPVPFVTTGVIVYRLTEILSRELWIILYRNKPITSFPRVLSVAILNYSMVTGLFGYLYGSGTVGLEKAAVISLTFAPLEPIESRLEIIQGAYCLAFLIVVLAVFVARARLSDHDAPAADAPTKAAPEPPPKDKAHVAPAARGAETKQGGAKPADTATVGSAGGTDSTR
jgi:hypothetical protein